MHDPSTAGESDNDDTYNMDDDMFNYDESDGPKGVDSDKLESDSDDC